MYRIAPCRGNRATCKCSLKLDTNLLNHTSTKVYTHSLTLKRQCQLPEDGVFGVTTLGQNKTMKQTNA